MRLNIGAKLSLTAFGLLILIAVLAPVIAPFDPWYMDIPYMAPDSVHLLGTNDLGQDILSELIYGFRVSMFIGITSSVIVTVIASLLGMVAGYYGGLVDKLITAFINIGMTVPDLPLTIVMVAFFKPSLWNIIAAICITGWTSTARMIRARTLQLKDSYYVQNAKLFGGSDLYIMFRHILPNAGDLVFVKGSLSVASAMVTEASLSYLGLGSPFYKSWGMILRDAFNAGGILNNYWWWYIPPILCICISIFIVSFLSNSLKNMK